MKENSFIITLRLNSGELVDIFVNQFQYPLQWILNL